MFHVMNEQDKNKWSNDAISFWLPGRLFRYSDFITPIAWAAILQGVKRFGLEKSPCKEDTVFQNN